MQRILRKVEKGNKFDILNFVVDGVFLASPPLKGKHTVGDSHGSLKI